MKILPWERCRHQSRPAAEIPEWCKGARGTLCLVVIGSNIKVVFPFVCCAWCWYGSIKIKEVMYSRRPSLLGNDRFHHDKLCLKKIIKIMKISEENCWHCWGRRQLLQFALGFSFVVYWQSMIVVIKISYCHWSCNDSVETNMLKMVMIESSTHNSSIEPDEGGNKQHWVDADLHNRHVFLHWMES